MAVVEDVLAIPAIPEKVEMHTALQKNNIEFRDFFGIEPSRVDRRFSIKLSEFSYLPKVISPIAHSVGELTEV